MSTATLQSAFGDSDDRDAFDLIVLGFDDEDTTEPVRGRPARQTERREAIDEGLGFRRHRTHQREA